MSSLRDDDFLVDSDEERLLENLLENSDEISSGTPSEPAQDHGGTSEPVNYNDQVNTTTEN